ncbi:ribonuclease H-like domain-containing protein [Crassisporium funariophilum]|nr:ribonuclease H-like domain-containing protein [Crassisporium funariophilum]
MERYLLAEESRVFNQDIKDLQGRNNLTYLMDGWEDIQQRSVYGSMLAEVLEFPVVLGLEELTRVRATAENLHQLSNRAVAKKNVKTTSIIAVCTDNPTTMQAFCRMWTQEHPWIIPIACFMHGINTIIGKIAVITKNSRIVLFFNSSHYWGGQLELVAKGKGVTRGLKTNTKLRFYALILQCLSVQDHKSALMDLCSRDNAQCSVCGLTLVSKNVVNTVFDLTRCDLTNQLIRICKPLVDIIGNVKSRNATLADCMLELIWAHQEVNRVQDTNGDDVDFANHARHVLNSQFHSMNTDIHWLALFLHPLCQKLAISSAIHSRKLEHAYKIALNIAHCWKWPKEMAQNLTKDIKAYSQGLAPFLGGKADRKDWWMLLIAPVNSHPLKAMAVKLFSIVPHAAKIERFFSNLGGIGTVKPAIAMGKSTHRKHSHMHTREEPGINTGHAEDLIQNFVYSPLETGFEDANIGGPDSLTVEDIDAEFERLEQQADAAAEDGDSLAADVPLDQVFDLLALDSICAGQINPITIDKELDLTAQAGNSAESWDPASLLVSLGV